MPYNDPLVYIAFGAVMMFILLMVMFILWMPKAPLRYINCDNCDTINDVTKLTQIDIDTGWFHCSGCGQTMRLEDDFTNNKNVSL